MGAFKETNLEELDVKEFYLTDFLTTILKDAGVDIDDLKNMNTIDRRTEMHDVISNCGPDGLRNLSKDFKKKVVYHLWKSKFLPNICEYTTVLDICIITDIPKGTVKTYINEFRKHMKVQRYNTFEVYEDIKERFVNAVSDLIILDIFDSEVSTLEVEIYTPEEKIEFDLTMDKITEIFMDYINLKNYMDDAEFRNDFVECYDNEYCPNEQQERGNRIVTNWKDLEVI